MPDCNHTFIPLGVAWTWLENSELTGNFNPQSLIRGRPEKILVHCGSCGHEWASLDMRCSTRPGTFDFERVGPVGISCPECGVEGEIEKKDLDGLPLV